MADRKIEIDFELGNVESVTSILAGLDKQAAAAGETMGGKAADGAGKLEGALAKAVAVGVFVGKMLEDVAMKAARWGLDMVESSVMAGARLEQLAGVASYLGERAGYTAGFIQQLSARMQETGITGQEAINTITQFIRYGFDLNQVLELQAAAQNSAAIAGKSSSEVMGLLTQGITTLQPQLLQTAGYTVNLEMAEKAYHLETGKSIAAMSGKEKQQLMLNAVLKQAADIQGVYSLSLDYAAKQATSSVRAWEQVSEQIGLKLLPLTNLAFASWYHLGEGVRDAVATSGPMVSDFVTGAASSLQVLMTIVGQVAGSFLSLTGFLIEHKNVVEVLAVAYGTYYVTSLVAAKWATIALNIETTIAKVTLYAQSAALYVTSAATQVMSLATLALAGDMAALGVAINLALGPIGWIVLAITAVVAGFKLWQYEQDKTAGPLDAFAAKLDAQQSGELARWTGRVEDMREAARKLGEAMPEQFKTMEQLEAITKKYSDAGTLTARSMSDIAAEAAKLNIPLEMMPPYLRAVVGGLQQVADAKRAAAAALNDETNSVQDNLEALKWEIANLHETGKTLKLVALAYGVAEEALKAYSADLKSEAEIAKLAVAANLDMQKALINNAQVGLDAKLLIMETEHTARVKAIEAELIGDKLKTAQLAAEAVKYAAAKVNFRTEELTAVLAHNKLITAAETERAKADILAKETGYRATVQILELEHQANIDAINADRTDQATKRAQLIAEDIKFYATQKTNRTAQIKFETEDSEKLWADYDAAVRSGSTVTAASQITEVWRVYENELRARQRAGTDSAEFYKARTMQAQAAADVIARLELEADTNSHAYAVKFAADAKAKYDRVIAAGAEFTPAYVEQMRLAAKAAQDALDNWGNTAVKNMDKAKEAVYSTIEGFHQLAMASAAAKLDTTGDVGFDKFTHMTAGETASVAAGQFVDLSGVASRWNNMSASARSAIDKRASGGPVSEGVPYWVGESGPELFVPSTTGDVKATGTMTATGGTASSVEEITAALTAYTLSLRASADATATIDDASLSAAASVAKLVGQYQLDTRETTTLTTAQQKYIQTASIAGANTRDMSTVLGVAALSVDRYAASFQATATIDGLIERHRDAAAGVAALTAEQRTYIQQAVAVGASTRDIATSIGATTEVIETYTAGWSKLDQATKKIGDSLPDLQAQLEKTSGQVQEGNLQRLIDWQTATYGAGTAKGLEGQLAGIRRANQTADLNAQMLADIASLGTGAITSTAQYQQAVTLIKDRYAVLQSQLPGRAGGGPVSAGQSYWVGELGQPELFTPDRSGSITPLSRAGSGGSGGSGGETINFGPGSISIGSVDSEARVRSLAKQLAKEMLAGLDQRKRSALSNRM